MTSAASIVAVAALFAAAQPSPDSKAASLVDRVLAVESEAVMELMPLAFEAMALQRRANERAAAHAAELAKRGIAEVPACGVDRYTNQVSFLSFPAQVRTAEEEWQ